MIVATPCGAATTWRNRGQPCHPLQVAWETLAISGSIEFREPVFASPDLNEVMSLELGVLPSGISVTAGERNPWNLMRVKPPKGSA